MANNVRTNVFPIIKVVEKKESGEKKMMILGIHEEKC